MSMVLDDPELLDERDDLAAAFSLISDRSGLITFERLRDFDEVRELLGDELVTEEELRGLWEAAPKATNGQLDEEGFIRVMQQLDALFEDVADDVTGETGETDGASSVFGTVDKRIRTEFAQLAAGKSAVDMSEVLRWETVKSLLEEGLLAVSEVENAFAAVAKAGKLDLAGFVEFNAAIDDLFVEEDEELSSSAEAAATIPLPADSAAAAAEAAAAPAEASQLAGAEAATSSADSFGAGSKEKEESEEIEALDMQSEFAALAGGADGLITFDSLIRWNEVQELVSDNQLSTEELRNLWSDTPKSPGMNDKIDFAGFAAFNRQLDELFEFAEEEGGRVADSDVANSSSTSNKNFEFVAAAAVAGAAPAAAAAAAGKAAAVEAGVLRQRLLDLLEAKTGGVGGCISTDEQTRGEAEEVITALVSSEENLVPQGQQRVLAALTGAWQLVYTSSNAMEYNKGITSVAATLPGAEFQGLRQELRVSGGFTESEYIETLLVGGQPLEVKVRGDWELKQTTSLVTGVQTLAVNILPQTMKYGFISLRADRWKPLRPMGLLDVVYLDDQLRIMRGQTATTAIFVLKRC